MVESREPLGRSSTTLSGCVTEWSAHAVGGDALGAMDRRYETRVSRGGRLGFVSVNPNGGGFGVAGASGRELHACDMGHNVANV